VATGGNPSSGQLDVFDKLCKEFKAQPVLSFDRDIAGYRFDAMYIARKAPNNIELSGIVDNLKFTFKNFSEVCERNLQFGFEKNKIAFEKKSGAITATAMSDKQMQLLVNYANIVSPGQLVGVEKSRYKDYNDDLRLNIRQPEFYKSLKISDISMKI
jgi:hypothetical protein